MEVIVLGLVIYAGYQLFRIKRRVVTEAVRAHAYLERRMRGKTADDANAFVDALLYDVRADIAKMSIRLARATYDKFHDGKTLAVVGYAYRQGLRPAMPFWYRISAQMAPVTRVIENTYGRSRSNLKIESDLAAISNDQNGLDDQREPLHSSLFPEDYKTYYNSLMSHVRRNNVPSYDYERDVELMVEVFGHDAFKEAFKDGTPPELLAQKLVRKLNSDAS